MLENHGSKTGPCSLGTCTEEKKNLPQGGSQKYLYREINGAETQMGMENLQGSTANINIKLIGLRVEAR